MSNSDKNDNSLIHVGSTGLAKVNNALRITENLLQTIDSVVIGEQEWMTRNLNVSRFRNGDLIPEVRDDDEWAKAGKEGRPAWCYYDNDPENGKTYGKLYNWYAVNDSRGLAPKEWRVPNESDWELLISYLGGKELTGGKLKITGTEFWGTGFCSYRENLANNCTGFSALPNGFRFKNGPFDSIGELSWIWSESDYADVYVAKNNNEYINVVQFSKSDGYAVRCLRPKSLELNT